jgi:nucleoside transporter
MMFLEYAVWGAWMPILSATLINRGFAPAAVGGVYSAFWLGYVISPFIGGQLVDRFMPSQVFLGITHLLAAGAAIMMAYQSPSSMSGHGMFIWMLIWATIFAPGVGVTNSISLYHIDRTSQDEASRERAFSWIRTAGTIGWVVVAVILTVVLQMTGSNEKGTNGPIRELMVTGVFGVIAAIYCFTLPNTPPNKDKRVDPLAFRKALFLFKSVPGFAVFMGISFFAATEFMFFYNLSGPFLETLKVPHSLIPVTKSISQIMEVVALGVLLPLWLPSKGMRWCLLVGSFAWPLRYLIFAVGKPVWLVVLSLGLHGFGYAFVIVVQQLYVDRVSPKDIRASAQNMLNMITLGVGNTLGSLFCGMVQQHFTTNGVTSWVPVFVLPVITTLICAVAYMATFKEPNTELAGSGEPAIANA